MIAFDGGRWGSARLVKPLSAAGFRVAALCPADNSLARTRYISKHFCLTDVRSSRRFEARLAEIMRIWEPALIVPADERVIACLHALVRRARSGAASQFSEGALAIIVASLGDPDQFDAMLLKSSTLQLARRLGVRVPDGATVSSAADAVAAARQVGFPAYIKSSFSWSGNGVSLCRNEAEMVAALAANRPRTSLPFRNTLRRIAHRDWYPTDATIDVQQSIVGTPAMFCAVAVNGKMIAGFAGITRQTCATNGPSSIVWIGAHAEMERASAAMIRAYGATGFIGFDFMIEQSTGDALLLECNPRPIPVCHLGSRIGVDLCAALAAELSGGTLVTAPSDEGEAITLFPNEWQRNPDGVAEIGNHIDIPFDDPELLHFMVNSTYAKLVAMAAQPTIPLWREALRAGGAACRAIGRALRHRSPSIRSPQMEASHGA
jgi:hypothetical protein